MKKLVIESNGYKTSQMLVDDDYNIKQTISLLNRGGKFIEIEGKVFRKATIRDIYLEDTTISDFLQEAYPMPTAVHFSGEGAKQAMINWCNQLHEAGMPDDDLRKIINNSSHFSIGELSCIFPYLYNSKIYKAIGAAGVVAGIFDMLI